MLLLPFILILVLIVVVSFGSRKLESKLPIIGILSSLLGWVFFLYIMDNSPIGDVTKLARNALVGPLILPFFLYYFSLVFPEKKIRFSYTLILLLVCSVLLSIAVHTDFFILRALKTSTDHFKVERNTGYYLYAGYLLFGIFVSCINILNTYQNANSKSRAKLRIFIFSLFLGLSLSLLFNVFLPTFFNNSNFISYGPMCLAISLVGTTYAIIRDDIFNLQSIFSRIGTFIFLILLVFGTFWLIFWLDISNNLRLLLICLVSAIWIIWGQPIRQKLQVQVEKSWVLDWYDSNELIKRVGIRLTNVFDRFKIIDITALKIQKTLSITSVLMIIAKTDNEGVVSYYELLQPSHNLRLESDDPFIEFVRNQDTILYGKELTKSSVSSLKDITIEDTHIIVPFFSKEDLEAILVFGDRQSNMPYSFHDVEVIETIAMHVSVFLDRMRPHEKIRKELAQTENIATMNKTIVRINHSINSPLTGLLMCVHYLKKDPTTETLNKVIHIIEESANNMKQIMRRLNTIRTPEWEQYGGGVDMLSLGDESDLLNDPNTQENPKKPT